MPSVVSQVPIQPVAEQGINVVNILFLGLLGLLGYVIWKALKSKKEEAKKRDRYKETLDMMRQHALLSADNRYFSSWFRPKKNAQVNRQFAWKETGKIKEEPLLGGLSRYMGHYADSHGNFVFAICAGTEYIVVPIVEVVVIPGVLVHMQDSHIIVNCVSVEKKSHSMPYWPVIRGVDGEIVKSDFYFVQKFWEEMVSTHVIENNGTQFMEAMEKITKVNPHVSIKRKTRGTDGGL